METAAAPARAAYIAPADFAAANGIPVDRVLRMPEVENLTGLKKSALYAAIDKGEFPAGVVLSGNAVGWRLSHVMAWIASRPVATRKAA